MLPILLTIGDFELHAFGVLVALGFVAGIAWCLYEAGRLGVSRERMLDLSFWLLIAGVLGARLLFVAVNAKAYAAYFGERTAELGLAGGILHTLIESVAVWNGGIVWYGGLFGAFAAGAAYLRRHGMPVWATADLVAPGVMLGLAIGRLGCLAAGDDYGKIAVHSWDLVKDGLPPEWWTLTFTDPRSLVPEELLGKPLYPTQIMMALNALGIFAVLLVMRRFKRFHGQIVCTMLMLYSITRSVIEVYRGDPGRGFWFNDTYSTSQVIGAVLFFVSIAMIIYLRRTQRVAAPGPA